MRTIKRQTIRRACGTAYIFYWAVWSQYVCIVKEDEDHATVSWKVVRNLPLGRKLWSKLAYGANTVGPKEAVDSISEWNTERIKWVRESLVKG